MATSFPLLISPFSPFSLIFSLVPGGGGGAKKKNSFWKKERAVTVLTQFCVGETLCLPIKVSKS